MNAAGERLAKSSTTGNTSSRKRKLDLDDTLDAARRQYEDKFSQPAYLIRRAHQISTAIFDEEFAGLNLTPIQFSLLLILQIYPSSDQTRLAGLAAIDKTSCWRALEKLAARKLVKVTAGADDRRKRVIELTAAGTAHLKLALPRSRNVQKRLMSASDPAGKSQFLKVLKDFVTANNEASRAPLLADGTDTD
jgi:DNA-binding MarR family transcriptional regulator